MTAGFRCRARLVGRCTLQCIRRSVRHTEVGARCTPNSRSINARIRRSVHFSVAYAAASDPALRRFASCSSLRSLSNGGRPIRPARRKPRRPSFSSNRLQRITDCRDDSTHRATSAGRTPRRSSSAASRRRCSSLFNDLRSRLIPISPHMSPSKITGQHPTTSGHSFTEKLRGLGLCYSIRMSRIYGRFNQPEARTSSRAHVICISNYGPRSVT
jgi:hypothetical protein